jgi:hypothetical protein
VDVIERSDEGRLAPVDGARKESGYAMTFTVFNPGIGIIA